MERCSVTSVLGRESSSTPPSPVVLPLGLSPPQQFHFGAPFPSIPRQFTLPSPLSPPVSPLLLPPTHWLGTLKAGEPPWLQSSTSPLLQSPPPSSLPFFLPSFLPAVHTQLPRALDLSKPKDDTWGPSLQRLARRVFLILYKFCVPNGVFFFSFWFLSSLFSPLLLYPIQHWRRCMARGSCGS